MKFPWYIWIPRILIILTLLFMALFSLDVFGMKASIWQILLGLLMHNIPSLVLLAVLLFTWRRPLLGGFFFIIVAVGFTVFFAIGFSKYFLFDFLAFVLPLLIAALFFLMAHYHRKPIEIPSETPNQAESNT